MKLASILPLFLICFLIAPTAFSQAGDQTINLHNEEIANYRAAKNQLMTDSLNSPLNADQIKKFDGLSYFPVDIQYRLDGRFMPDESRSEVSLNTTSGSKINLIKVGTVTFSLEGKSYSLMVFQNKNLPEFDDRSQQLFIPFADLSNGKNTNPQGRYLPVNPPDTENNMVIDFNLAINPYSAYNNQYFSVVPPPDNSMGQVIGSGERKYEDR